MRWVPALIVASAIAVGSAHANSLVAASPQANIAKSSIAASPDGEWNRLSSSDGHNIEVWTRDGDDLNRVAFFGAVTPGMPLYRERKNAPLPKVTAGMLLPDIPALFETTYRARYQVSRMSIDRQEPTTINGKPGIRFAYSYVRSEDEVQRSGVAVGAIVDGKLDLVVYEAPSIYYFEKDLPGFEHIVSTLRF
jgi:hypothetical protein